MLQYELQEPESFHHMDHKVPGEGLAAPWTTSGVHWNASDCGQSEEARPAQH